MSEVWTRVTLDEAAEILTGFPFKSARFSDAECDVRLLRGDNVAPGKVRWETARHWPRHEASAYDSYFLRAGDLVLAMDRPWIEAGLKYAVLTQDDAPSLLVQRVARLRARAGFDQRFLQSVIASPQFIDYIRGVETGTSIPHISAGQIRAYAFACPPWQEQIAIGQLISAITDKIALNYRTNRTLEALMATLFQKWRDDNELSAEAVRAEVLIARGVLLINDGYRAKNSEMAETGLPFARAGNLQAHFDFTSADLLGEAGIRAAGDKVSQPFDCVFTSKGTVGRIAQVLQSTPRFVYSPQLCFWRSLRPDELNPLLLAQWMNSDEFREQIDAVKGQTDMADYVSLRDQRRMQITLPFSADQTCIGARLESLARMQDANFAESRTLTALRDALLPQLLSGRIRIRNAERLVEATV